MKKINVIDLFAGCGGLSEGFIEPTTRIQGLYRYFSRYASATSMGVFRSVVEECLEEVFVDPVIEAAVSYYVRELGFDATIQMTLSSLASSVRESIGPIVRGTGALAQHMRQTRSQMRYMKNYSM